MAKNNAKSESYKLAWMKIPCQGIEGQGETKNTFNGIKDFVSITGPELDENKKPYVTVFFWKKVG